MADISVTKLEAAKQMTESAVEMLFNGHSPVSVFALASAANQILRDIGEVKGAPTLSIEKSHIVPGMEGKYWSARNSLFSKLKHAKEDVNSNIDFDECVCDFVLWNNCLLYKEIEDSLPNTMMAFLAWFQAVHPDLLLDVAPQKGAMFALGLNTKNRSEQLENGRSVLQVANSSDL